MANEKDNGLRDELFTAKKNGYDRISIEERVQIEDYSRGYMDFLNKARMEREAVRYAVALAEEQGFSEYVSGEALEPGSKVYFNNRGKMVAFAVIGKESPEKGINITAAHIDSPRLDLKPNPLYEDSSLAYFKTHYYGGIKKYQWTAIPLALHGVVVKANGESVKVNVGEDDNDPQFCVTDLLPHLAQDQMKQTMSEGIKGEQLNILIGSRPFSKDEGSDKVKLNIIKILNEKYGITEGDFLSAELELVPAFKARDIGFDRSLIGAYGHDDRICAWTAFEALITAKPTKRTQLVVLVDKEETGSDGVSGMQGQFFEMLEIVRQMA